MRRSAAPAVEALGIGIVGVLHAAAAGAVILAGLNLAVAGLVDASNPAQAAAAAVALGLACLRVPLESGDLHGTFAPLSGLFVTLWGLHAAVRRTALRERGRTTAILEAGGGLAAACAGAAALTAAGSTVEASVPGAAAAGLVWGGLAGLWATRPHRGAQTGARASIAWARPGVTAALVACGVVGIWLAAAVVVRAAGLPVREAAGIVVLALAAAPNIVVALVVVGLGASVDVALAGTALADPLTESLSLSDWRGSGAAPPYAWALVLAPLAGVVAAARRGGPGAALVRGVRNGVVFGGALFLLGWAGSFGAAAAAGGERVSVRLGFAGAAAFGLAVVWNVAGAVLVRLTWPGRFRRAPKVSDP